MSKVIVTTIRSDGDWLIRLALREPTAPSSTDCLGRTGPGPKADLGLLVTLTMRRAVCAQPHLRVTVAVGHRRWCGIVLSLCPESPFTAVSGGSRTVHIACLPRPRSPSGCPSGLVCSRIPAESLPVMFSRGYRCSPRALKRVRYSCGVTASSRRKLRRIVSSDPKPQR